MTTTPSRAGSTGSRAVCKRFAKAKSRCAGRSKSIAAISCSSRRRRRFGVEMEKADKDIRDRVTGGGYTDDEMKALARAGNNQDAVAKVVAARNKRLVDAYRAEVVNFRAQIPELRAEFDKKMEEYAEYRSAVDRCNETDSASRSVTDATLRATQAARSDRDRGAQRAGGRSRPDRREPAPSHQRNHADDRSAVRTPTEATAEAHRGVGRSTSAAVLRPARP